MKITDEAVEAAANDHRLTVDGTCTCGFTSHKVRSVRIHITKANMKCVADRSGVSG